jgi:hypothetical protein
MVAFAVVTTTEDETLLWQRFVVSRVRLAALSPVSLFADHRRTHIAVGELHV